MINKFVGVLLLALGSQSAYANGNDIFCSKGEKFSHTLELGVIAVELSATCTGDWEGEWTYSCKDDGDSSEIGVEMSAIGVGEGGVTNAFCYGVTFFANSVEGLAEADFKRMRQECEGGKGADKTKIRLEAKAVKGDGGVNLCADP